MMPRCATCVCLAIAAVIMGVLAAGAWRPAWSADRLQELEHVAADLDRLDRHIEEHMQRMRAARGALRVQEQVLAAEIRELAGALQIKTLQQATRNPRIGNNIVLLGLLDGCLKELDEKLESCQSGRHRLAYLRRMVEDDKRMLALSDLKTDALTRQVSELIDSFGPQTLALSIDPQNVTPLPAQMVWERIMKAGITVSTH
jgi:hypothetical protein